MMPKYNQTRLLQQTFKVKQIEIGSRLIQGQANKTKKKALVITRHYNRLPETRLQIGFSKGFWNLNFKSCNRLPVTKLQKTL